MRAIGQAVAKVGEALGMKILYTTRRVHDDERYVSLETLLAQSDVISLHCPQTAENLNLINAETIARMKDGAMIINTARGGLVDEAAVAEALCQGKLAYFAADVVSRSPSPRTIPF